MKKLKRDPSHTSKQKQTKPNPDFKTPLTSKKNLLHKKQISHHKENKSILQQGSIAIKSSKKTNIKSKQRSKSLLCDKKIIEPLTQSSYRNALFNSFHKKREKDETDISAHLNSIRYEKPFLNGQNFYSNLLSSGLQFPDVPSEVKENEDLIKIKHLQEENQEFRVKISAIKEEMKQYVLENQIVKEENIGLKHRISSFQLETSAQVCQMKAKEIELTANHKKQQKYLQSKINKLQIEVDKIAKEKSQAEDTINQQQQSINQLENDKKVLQAECSKERSQKEVLKKEKEEAIMRVMALEQQLEHFQQNLLNFDKLKETYEARFRQLETQKQKIKKNAYQLLQIVQNYRCQQ